MSRGTIQFIAGGAVVLVQLVCTAFLPEGTSQAAESPSVSFAKVVKPILARRCFACHGPDLDEGGLRLHKKDSALVALDSGNHAIVPGRPDESVLLTRIESNDEAERMPPEGKPLAREEIDALRAWIAQGAEWEPHWAFVPPKAQPTPVVTRGGWVRNPIDAFVLAKLEAAGLTPAAPADKRTLARRAYYNVTGLPPTSEQLDAFVQDDSADAWERLVDELLASRGYGEQWARHWLDVVRYAETNSFERDGLKPNAWKYRDYVIRSLNEDKPYDQFVREQLAGDELDAVSEDSIIATGYYRLGIYDDEPADQAQARYDEWDDILSTTSQAFLALTVGCARCHDHKIDPIPQADYYGLLAFFADVTPYGVGGDESTNSQWDLSPPDVAAVRRSLREKESEIEREKVAMEVVGIKRMPAADQNRSETPGRQKLLDEKLHNYLSTAEFERYQETLSRLEAARNKSRDLPPADSALALALCDANPDSMHILVRGNPHVPGDVVEPHFPELFESALPTIPEAPRGARSAGRRRILAEWIASPRNMLTARVIVNRVWQHHFGRGIVRSANNFGQLGTPPTHPELLDWLALWLIDHDWQLKPLHRLIMTSSAYQMSSNGNERALAIDPTNDLLWRFDMRRLSAEELRDSILMATGEFNPKMFGPSIYPKLSQEEFATQSRPGEGWGESSPEELSRRSVYIFIKRSLLPPLHTAFDFPDVDNSCEARFITVQPSQALALMNGEFVNAAVTKLADRVSAVSGIERRQQVARVVQAVVGRPATEDEIAEGVALLDRLQKQHAMSARNALRQWCLIAFNLSEFVYLD